MLDRRSLLAGGAAFFATAACSRSTSALGGGGANPLPIPPLLDAQPRQSFALQVQSGTTSFYPGRSSDTLGYYGSYLGPTISVRPGDDVAVAVAHRPTADTTVVWPGVMMHRELEGGPPPNTPTG